MSTSDMGYLLWPFVVLCLFMGIYATAEQVATSSIEPPPSSMLQEMGGWFLAYRDAVAAYSRANPSFTGQVARTQLVLPPGLPVLAGEGNLIGSAASGQTYVLSYASISADGLMTDLQNTGGDATLGRSNGTTWTSPIYGSMGSLPTSVASGDVVSYFTYKAN